MATVRKIEAAAPRLPVRKKVAAYARISMQTERMSHSLSAQISYYSDLIQKNPQWEYAGVYADNAVTGTKSNRAEFQRMLSDCEAGKIDIILTKSISRFARNTVDLLETVRHLKELGIEVRFEKENINSLSGDGEVMLTLLASFAQEEVRSISENVKWHTVKRFEQGLHNGRFHIYGYRWDGDTLVVEPEEAKIVKLIYDNFLKGLSAESTEKQLEEMGVKSYTGGHFGSGPIRSILSNITYTGNFLFQRVYTVDPISKKQRKNKGELPQYWVENTHEAIIPLETYNKVQEEIKRRKELGVLANWSVNTSCFTSRIKCGCCGKSYCRCGKKGRKDPDEVYYIWTCRTKKDKGAKSCASKSIPENTLKQVCAEVLGTVQFDEDLFAEQVDRIITIGEDLLEFHFHNGTIHRQEWHSTASRDCWTDERKKSWGELHKCKDTNPNKRHCREFTGFIKCGCCGSNYCAHERTYADGVKTHIWHCSGDRRACNSTSIKDETMKALVSDVLGLDSFDEKAMDAAIEKAVITPNLVTFHFRDGHTEEREYRERKRVKPKEV